MNQQRGPLLLILWAAILVSGGYASPIHQSDIHDDFAFHGTYAIYGSTSTDNWLGGTGDWSDLTFWSGGLPGIASDVYINTGNDLAYLDTNATIASLTLGGTTGSSELRSTSTTNYLTIAGALTINQTGTLSLLSGDTVAAASLSVNSGIINLNGGSTLQIYGDASNSGSIYVGYTSGGNNLTINGVLTNHGYLGVGNGSAIMGGLVNDGNINGSLTVDGNASNSGAISLGSGFLQVNGGTLSNSGSIYLSTGLLQVNGAVYNSGQVIQDFGSVLGITGTLTNDVLGSIIFYGGSDQLSVQGDVNNAGLIGTGSCCWGGWDGINISGTLNNTGTLSLGGYGNTATIGSIVNSGAIDLAEYDPQHEVTRLQVNGDVSNSGRIVAEGASVVNIGGTLYNSGQIYTGESGGNVVNIGGTLDNTGYFSLEGPFDSSNIGTLVNRNGGGIDVEGMSSLSVNGDANNSGGIGVGGDSVLNINGTLNNSGGLSAYGYGDGGSNGVSVGNLVNSGAIELEYGSGLQVYGDASNSGSISLGSLDGGNSLGVNGTLTNQGSLALNSSDTASLGSLVNSGTGTINVQNGSTANVGSLANGGAIDLENGSMLQVYGDASNTGSISLGSTAGGNNLTVGGTLTNPGSLALNSSDTAGLGSLVNSGTINLDGGSTLQVSGDTNNPGWITLGSSAGGNSFSVNGTLTNQGTIIGNASDTVTAGSLVNGGAIGLVNGSVLQVNGDANNSGLISLGSFRCCGRERVVVGGVLTNEGSLSLLESDYASVGSLINSGDINLQNGSSLQVNGDVANNGSIETTQFGSGGNSITISGALNNSGQINVNGPGDYVGIDSLVNGGNIFVENGSNLQVNGDASNYGSIIVGSSVSGNSMTVGGILTNQGSLALYGSYASAGSLINSGDISLQDGSALQVNGGATNNGSIETSEFGDGGNSITISGTLNNTGQINLDGPGDAAIIGSITNSGVIDLEGGSTLQVNRSVSNSGQISTSYYGNGGNTLTMPGMLTNNAGGTFSLGAAADVANVGRITNAGSISIASGATLTVSGASAPTTALPGFVNTGIVNIAPGSTLSTGLSYVQTAGETIVDGTLRAFGRVALVNFAGGSVYGNGTIQGPVMSNAAINLGDAPMTVGQMSFMGNYAQEANGSLTFDIAGAAPGQYDQLNVSGHATLNGLMTVDLLQGFVPQIGNMFDIMNFSGLSGTFSNLLGLPINGQEHFVLEYNATDLTLDVVSGGLLGADNDQAALLASVITSGIAPDGGSSKTSSITSHYGRSGQSSPTPEPGSLLLLGSGLLCVGYSIRRRMTK